MSICDCVIDDDDDDEVGFNKIDPPPTKKTILVERA